MMMQRLAGNLNHHERPASPRSTEMTTIDISEGDPEIIHEAASRSNRNLYIHPEQVVLSHDISTAAEDAWSTSEVLDADPYIHGEWRVAMRLGGLWSQSGAAATSSTISDQATSNPPARTCRICTEPETDANSNPILMLGCQCRDDLGQAHQDCLEEWFASRRLLPQQLRTCEICRTEMSTPIMSLIDNALPRVTAQYAGQVPWGQEDDIQQSLRNHIYRRLVFALFVVGRILLAGMGSYLVIGKQEGYF